ncbi:MAG: glycosyl hydrolase family 65 protein [Motiliproteus sp.]
MSLINMLSSPEWLVEENDFDVELQNTFETLFTVGNGYLGTRATLEESNKGEFAATYISGIFDNHDSTVIDLVNAPDWLPVSIWVDGIKLNIQSCRVLSHRRVLDMKTGALYRFTRFKDSLDRITSYESVRFASIQQSHLCAMRIAVTPENYDATLVVESSIDGGNYNLDRIPNYAETKKFHPETKWNKWAKSKHLRFVSNESSDKNCYLEMETIDTKHRVGYAATLRAQNCDVNKTQRRDYEKVTQIVEFKAKKEHTYIIDKLVSIFTSRDVASDIINDACMETLNKALHDGFDRCFNDHINEWNSRWNACDCQISGDKEAMHALRFNIYHLLISANPNDPKVNIGAKTLSGEGYKGHVFWDTEIFMLPFFIYTQPETAKSLLLYRYHTLEGARKNATLNGYSGAQYPWESADTGLETTPKWTADGVNRIWTGEEELHITADVAYGILTYLSATGDMNFILNYGAEMLFETARFWISRIELNTDKDRYELNNVIGPDEFHEHVNNNVYTNVMVRWNLQNSALLLETIKQHYSEEYAHLAKKLCLSDEEVTHWVNVAAKIYIPFDTESGLIEQFEDYFQCKEVPIVEWDKNDMPCYPAGYDHFNAGETTLLKQPDVVMLMYVLPDEYDDEIKRRNYEFYEKRTLHKSSLSPCMHAIMGIEVEDTHKAEQYFLRSALVDLVDNQGNTEWGIHAASTGGTWMTAVFGFGGFRVRQQKMSFKPWLPSTWNELTFKLRWHGDCLDVSITQSEIRLLLHSQKSHPEEINITGEKQVLQRNERQVFCLNSSMN